MISLFAKSLRDSGSIGELVSQLKLRVSKLCAYGAVAFRMVAEFRGSSAAACVKQAQNSVINLDFQRAAKFFAGTRIPDCLIHKNPPFPR
jgi:hypothetical protein